jgi:hypothetical protein
VGYVLRVAELNMPVPLDVVEEVLVLGGFLNCGRSVVVLLLPLLAQV